MSAYDDESDLAIPEDNPFRLPTDEEVFVLRDEERKRNEEERKKQLALPVHLKSTWSARVATSSLKFKERKTNYAKMMNLANRSQSSEMEMSQPREKEKLSDFIAKKREMFLIQMSLDTKRQEIRKLDEKAQARERKLRDDERTLEKHMKEFDEFLKENDIKAVEAMKKAEQETKAKQEKLQEIKKLNSQIASVKSEISKYDEQLDECMRYKQFLDQLTPSEYVESQMALKRKRRDERRAKERAEKAQLAPEDAHTSPPQVSKMRKGGSTVSGHHDDAVSVKSLKSTKSGRSLAKQGTKAQAIVEVDDDDDLSDTEIDMYFKEPQQLLDIFTQLEESNLFLIQNCQEQEEALDMLKQEFAETKRKMDADTQNLKTQMRALEGAIAVEEAKADALADRSNKNTGIEEQEHLLEDMSKKVAEVYVQCGFDNDANLSTLQMLTNIESKLEDMLTQVSLMPEEYVEAAEKAKEKERRQRQREEKLETRRREMEERIRKAVERSKAPVKKKTGKPIMFRSVPIEKKLRTRKEVDKKEEDEEDIKEFFVE